MDSLLRIIFPIFLLLFSAAGAGALSLSGKVAATGGAPVSGVTVTVVQVGGESGPWTAVSDADGRWAVSHPLLFGNLSMTPAKTGYSFAPGSRTVFTDISLTAQDFTATALGRITLLDAEGAVQTPGGTRSQVSAEGAGDSFLFTVSNAGSGPLVDIAAQLTGAQAAAFVIESAPPAVLAAGGRATVLVRRRAEVPDTVTAALQILSSDPEVNPLSITLVSRVIPLPQPSLTLTETGAALRWHGEHGVVYIAETSTDLTSWSPLALVAGAGAMAEFAHDGPVDPLRFYRVRILPETTAGAIFDAARRVLRIAGTLRADTLTLGVSGGGIVINGGAVGIAGGPVTAGAPVTVIVDGGEGNDVISAAALPGSAAVVLHGGAGNDTLTGGGAADELHGGPGDDVLVWNPGGASDVIHGEEGLDTFILNGANLAESFTFFTNDTQLLISRDVGGVLLTLSDVEKVELKGEGGADVITVEDLSSAPVQELLLRPGRTSGTELDADSVRVNGTGGDDVFSVTGSDGSGEVYGLPCRLLISDPGDSVNRLTLLCHGGDDVVEASGCAATFASLILDGGGGNDVLIGGDGVDQLFGRAGDDVLVGGPSLDVLDGGAGENVEIQ